VVVGMPNFDSREPNRGGILIILSQVEERSLSGRVIDSSLRRKQISRGLLQEPLTTKYGANRKEEEGEHG